MYTEVVIIQNVSEHEYDLSAGSPQEQALADLIPADLLNGFDPHCKELAQSAAGLILSFGLSAQVAQAALAILLIEHSPELEDQIVSALDDHALALIGEWRKWRSSYPLFDKSLSAEKRVASGSHEFRELLRELYRSFPDMSFISILIAWADVKLGCTTDPDLTEHIKRVYLPLAEIMGLWLIRHRWLKRIIQIKSQYDKETAEKYQSLTEKMLPATWDDKEAFLHYVRQSKAYSAGTHVQKSEGTDHRNWRANVFRYLHNRIRKLARQQGISPLPLVEMRHNTPSMHLLRIQQNRNTHQEDLLNELWIRIIVHDEADCYRLLGIVHQLGRPITRKHNSKFDDQLVSPMPDGYRALHTGLRVSRSDQETGPEDVTVEARIVTLQMHTLNDHGVFVALKNPQQYQAHPSYRYAWWHPEYRSKLLEKLNRKLQRQKSTRNLHYESLGAYLSQHKLGSVSPILYVFSPRGQLFLMEAQSTALDFAFEVHGQLGLQAARIKVNHQLVSYAHQLRNGDHVEVVVDDNFPGPETSWLHIVRSNRAKSVIRHYLQDPINSQSVIWQKLLFALEKQLGLYAKQRGAHFEIPAYRLERFLIKYARSNNLAGLEGLYLSLAELPENRLEPLAEKLIRRLFDDEWHNLLLDADGNPVSYRAREINFCEACLPVPGDEITGVTREFSQKIKIHRMNCKQLTATSTNTIRVWLTWIEQISAEEQSMVYHLLCQDRQHLLNDALEKVHGMPEVFLHAVEAYSQPDGTARIDLTVSSKLSQSLIALVHVFETIPSVRQVWPSPVKYAFRFLPGNSAYAQSSYNPYMEEEVFHRLTFFNRVAELQTIFGWLESKHTRILLVRGQRRIGKTSLLKYLSQVALQERRIATPVYIELNQTGQNQFADLERTILKEIYQTLSIHGEYTGQLNVTGVIEEIARIYRVIGQPLLIILDEFDRWITSPQWMDIRHTFVKQLNQLMTAIPGIHWILVISDSMLIDKGPLDGVDHLINARGPLTVPPFTKEDIHRFVQEPAASVGLSTAPEVIERVAFLSAGIPYYIRRLCFHMVQYANRHHRKRLEETDLNEGLQDLMRNGRTNFDHFFRYLSPLNRCIIKAIASQKDPQAWMPETRIIKLTKRYYPGAHDSEILASLSRLNSLKIIVVDSQVAEAKARILVPLFAEWAKDYFDPLEPA